MTWTIAMPKVISGIMIWILSKLLEMQFSIIYFSGCKGESNSWDKGYWYQGLWENGCNKWVSVKQEIRITNQNNILKNTDVFLWKEGKQINFNFITGVSESDDILKQNILSI